MQVFNQSFVVMSILEDQKLVVTTNITPHESVCSDSVAKVFFSLCQRWHFQYILRYTWSQLKHCRVGQTVRVTSNVSWLRQVQSGSDNWRENMVTVSFRIGHVFYLSNVELLLVCIPSLDSWSDWTCD